MAVLDSVYLLHWHFITHLPTFLLVLKEEEEDEDVEEVKLYDFDWTVPPELINKHTNMTNVCDTTVPAVVLN